ncbi:MAG: dTDP-4-dehydrorhamnose reductase [Candidatus Staskawiczbacteria bacterium RIFCSPHIGHO2_01_FULL_34_27]|uniref:dTDP-4-dehydrorhamnose reductase n=1 Tax=Candidatus Staskawiczbacteria bacterium RIFCSPHIGHO2_01_FULL_34_27 TaxID=1802199 RepID=A0A1G2HK78_9BACT|nr:MAG: dTDP-4-dehydrorhamnose reductase [Candidatus Staskawiczbacteria bacterium RIFCSPHIGHO2_01_FULL_34_27]
MKKVLLIGKTGQLGSEIMKDAFSFGFEIVGFEQEELDVTDHLQVKEKIEKIKPDIVINTSAYQIIPMCEKNPLLAMAVNFIAAQNLARICQENNTIFVTYSSDYVFDGTKGVPNEEDDAPNPLQMYGMSKLAGEYAALHIHSGGAFVIRTCGLYGGKKGSPEKGNFVLNIIKEAEGKEVIEVSCEQIVSPTYAGDLSRATLKLLTSKAKPGIYHLVNEGMCNWYEFTKEIFKLAGVKKELKPVDRSGFDGSVKRPKFSALKNTKARDLGITLPSWQEGLKSYFNFLDNNG